MTNATEQLLVKSLERYKTRLQEVEAMGWYKDASVTQNEIARIDSVLAGFAKGDLLVDLNRLQALESELAETRAALEAQVVLTYTAGYTLLRANDLLEAVQWAYRKHHLGDDTIGWDELSDKLLDALCNAMGADGYLEWSKPYGRSQEDE